MECCRAAKKRKVQKRKNRCARKKKCHRPGPITRNPYLNFLRDFRKQHCGLTAVEIVVQGAQCWRRLSPKDKCKYVKMARCAPKRKRRRRRSRC